MDLSGRAARNLRCGMRERLAVARRQVHEARTPSEVAEARAHLDLCCDMLDALRWDDIEPEPDIAVDAVRNALTHHLEVERALADTHDEDQRGRALEVVAVIKALLGVFEAGSS